MPYKKLYLPGHRLADLLGYVAEHKLIAEQMLGRKLRKGEIVHHKDHEKSNNDPSNLQVMSRQEHQQIPILQARFLSEKGLMDEFFAWWDTNKNAPLTQTQELQRAIVAAENKREAAKRQLYKISRKEQKHVQKQKQQTESAK